MAESAVSALLRNVGNFAVHETNFLRGVSVEVAFLKDELMRLQGYLKDAERKGRSGSASVAIFMGQIRHVAYEAENVIEAAEYLKKRNRLKKGFIGAISRYAGLPTDLTTLHKIGVEIQRVRRKLNEIFQSAERLKIDLDSHVVDESLQDYGLMHQIYLDSWNDLPNHLRHCFLYLAAFPEDFTISLSDLMSLWIAENFIPATQGYTLEETSRKYVNDLAQRSLVQVVQTSDIHGCIEGIRIEDNLRDWCIEQATHDGFLDVIAKMSTGQVGASSSHTLMSCRSSFQNSLERNLHAPPNLRALLGFGLSSAFFPELRFLRVLHVENSRLENFSNVIGGCIHLRNLTLRKCGDIMIPSIGKLLYLQTINLSETYPMSRKISGSLWDIPTLRYVRVPARVPLPRSVQIPLNLRELHIHATKDEYGKDPMPILEMLPCLVVLELNCYHRPYTMSFGAQGFPRLEELKLEYCRIEWRMEIGTMPKLSCLSFLRCLVDQIPNQLMCLPSLRSVSVHYQEGVIDYWNDSTLKWLKEKGCEVTLAPCMSPPSSD